MAMPADLVLIRHGQSEANIVQKRIKEDPAAVAPDGFYDRHDSRIRLSALGRRQATTAGEWLRAHDMMAWDRYYVSPHLRTMETAALLALHGRWRIDVRWRERDWGEYGMVNEVNRAQLYGPSQRLKKQNLWYWCPPGGESLATGVYGRFRDILDTLHREAAGQRVLAVTHGEMIDVARFVIEGLTPETWLAQERDPTYKIPNCQIMHYTRRDPVSGALDARLRWMRAICPWDPAKSWRGGEWIAFGRTFYTDDELTAMADAFPPLFG